MLRLSLLLCIGMYAALMTLGEDRGQMRPGLAKAVEEGRMGAGRNGIELAAADPAPAPVPEPTPVAQPEPLPEPVPAPLPEPQVAEAPALPEPLPEPLAEPLSEPLADVAAGREVVMVLEDPVFSLSTLGNEPVPGAEAAALAEPVAPDPAPEVAPEIAASDIWYVNASSVNVRAAPSTEAEILTKLATGEATLMLEQVDADWARVVIQGDGVEGYVAIRYLSPGTP